MIIPHQSGPVAEWHFHGPLVQQLTTASVEYAFGNTGAVLLILADQQLLVPNSVRLSRWMRAIPGPVAQSERVDKPTVDLRVDGPSFLSEALSCARSAIDQEHVYPLDIEICGEGTVFCSDSASIVDDLVWLRATTLDSLMLSVGTQSDAWLPFTLQGSPQSDIFALNAGRLADALRQIQRQTGFENEEGLQSPYSVMKGFQLDNVRYADGSVADVS